MKTAKTLSWIIAAAGLWEIIAPFAIGYSATSAAMVDAIILGILLLGLGIWAALVNTSVTIKVLSWINAVLGLWLVVAPFALSYSKVSGATVNDIIVGIVVIILGVWAAVVPGRSTTE
ncbi:MAG: hypothetical protein DRP57_03120 [Spirochaetes bacterium]|nr:MAG: hypothetical protein DRP57_03120 [Spirochaetota bacterium]